MFTEKTIEVWGHQPVPHDFKFQRSKDGQSMVPSPLPQLRDWQAAVRKAAREAMGGDQPYCGNVAVEYVFVARTPYGSRPGDWWSQEVTWNAATGKASKRASTQPDTDNLSKAVSDALARVVFADDVTVCGLMASRIYGPKPGVRITVRPL